MSTDASAIRAKLLAAQQAAIKQQSKKQPVEPAVTIDIAIPIGFLPELQDEEFLIDFVHDNNRIVVCAKELAWHETMDIDNQCYSDEESQTFHSDEKMMRLTLSKSIKWVASFPEEKIIQNTGDILSNLTNEAGNIIWRRYVSATVISAEQAAELISAARSYFMGEAQENTRVPSIVVIVDMMAQGVVTYSEKEFMNISSSKMEKIKLILAARMEALYVDNSPEAKQADLKKEKEQEDIKKLISSVMSRQQPRRK